MLIELRQGIAINPYNLIYMHRANDAVVFRLYNGRAHKIPADDPRDAYKLFHKDLSRHVDMLDVHDYSINVDAIVGIAISDKGVAINTVQDNLSVFTSDYEKRFVHYNEYIEQFNRLTSRG